MKKNEFFLLGHIYNLNDMTIEEIQADVKKNLQAWIGCSDEDMIEVNLSLQDNRFKFHLQRAYPSRPYKISLLDEEPYIFCRDSDFILGRNMPGGIELSYVPFGVGWGYEYSFPVSEFISIYKKNCKTLKVMVPKNISIKATDSELDFSFDLPYKEARKPYMCKRNEKSLSEKPGKKH